MPQPATSLAWNCEYCDSPQKMTVLDRWWITPGSDDDFDPFERALAKCTNCEMPYVLGREADFREEESPLEQIFPEFTQPLPRSVPATIRHSHDEAIKCRKVGAFTATTVMARRGVEAICAEQGKTSGTLAAKLKELQQDGVIDQRLFDWSSVVRNLGNSGAHDINSSLTREDADDAIYFFEALVNYLYAFQQRYKEHIERKKQNKSEGK
jgi:hypothetical protein